MSQQTQSPAPAPTGRRRLRFPGVLVLVALVSAFAGAITARAFSHPNAFMGGPYGIMAGPGPMMEAPTDAEEAAERAAWMVRRFARHINALPEQKSKLEAIATAAARDTFPLHQKMVALRRQGFDLMREPTISRDKIEALRAEQVANVEALSKRLAKAIGDVAEALTPDQRKELADDLSFFARHMAGPRG